MTTSIGPRPKLNRDAIVGAIELSALIGQDQQIVRDGREFRTLCPWHADTDPSLTINDDKGFYHCFSCGAHGTAVDWLMFQRGIDIRTALEELGHMSNLSVLPSAKTPRVKRSGSAYKAIVPVPDDAPGPDFEIAAAPGKPALGAPLRTWTYRDQEGRLLGYVCRYRGDPVTGKKEVRTWTYGSYPQSDREWDRRVRWRVRRWPGDYPLYGLWKLSEPGADSRRIIIVEGEKCADALQGLLPDMIVLSWVGGSDGLKHANWEPLVGLPNVVVLWPDADEAGRKAMEWIAAELGDLIPGDLWLLNVDDMPKGWDCADAIEGEGKDAEWFGEFVREMLPDEQTRLRKVPRVSRPAALVQPKPVQEPEVPVKDAQRPTMPSSESTAWWNQPWAEKTMKTMGEKPQLIKCEYNAAVPLRHDDDLRDALRFNTVRNVVEIVRPLPWGDDVGEWRDQNLTALCQWLNLMRYHMGKEMMGDAVDRVAYENRFNPLSDYLESLKWDGEPRLERWLPKYAGTQDTLYAREIGKRWMIGAAARGFRPGTQVDSMLVLEGAEGKYKTSLLRALGGSYFAPFRGDIGASDGRASSLAASNWIIEFAELEALNKTSFQALKDFLTTTDEMIRLPYRRNAERIFRSGVFAGTTNETEWLPPDGDHRRFWPVRAEFCDVDALRRDRDQLWAEAFHMYQKGVHWWIDPGEIELIKAVKSERDERRFHDEWFTQIATWSTLPVNRNVRDYTMQEVARAACGVDSAKLDKATQMRIGKILGAMKWERVKVRSDGGTPWMWRRPDVQEFFD